MTQLVQVIGSLLILVPFVLVQAGRMPTGRIPYLTLNAVGSTALAIDAGLTQQWGFLLLEGVWAVVSVIGIGRRVLSRGRPMPSPEPVSEAQEAGASHRDTV